MKNDIQFYEKQNQKRWWMWLIVVVLNLPFIYGIIWQIILGNQFGNNPMSNTGLIIVSVIIFTFTGIMLASKMETEINSEGIYFRYFPINLKFKHIPWTDISFAYTRQHNSMLEFGGFGIRQNSKGKAYIVSGNHGLQLELKNGKKILIGTQQPNDLDEILRKLEIQKEKRSPGF